MIGAAALQWARGKLDLVCDFHPDSYVWGEQAFLYRALAEYANLQIDLVWDDLSARSSMKWWATTRGCTCITCRFMLGI